MANKFTDSFSNYSTLAQLQAKWNGATASTCSVSGSFAIGAASQGMNIAGNNKAQVNIPGYAHYFFGIRLKINSGLAGNLFGFVESLGGQFVVSVLSGGTITITNPSATVLNTSTLTVASGSTHYYEVELLLNASGTFKLWVDGVLFCTFSGSTVSGSNLIAQFGVGSVASGSTSLNVADCYINDDTTSICNGRQGDTTVNSYRVASAGTYAQFNRGGTDTGTNAGQLNKALADPTSINVSNVVNNRDNFQMGTVPAPSVGLFGARLWGWIQKDSFGSRQAALTCLSGAADNIGTTQTVNGPGYFPMSQDYSADPNTSALWASVTPLNAAQFGYKIIT